MLKWATKNRVCSTFSESCSRSFFLASLLALALCGCPQTLTAQSTPSAPPPPVPLQSGDWSLSKASLELVTRLTERNDEARTLLDRLANSEARWQAAENKAASLSLTVDALQADLQATSNLLASSRTELVDYKAAVATAHDLDQAAVKQARDQRDEWALRASAGGVILGAVAVLVAKALGWVK